MSKALRFEMPGASRRGLMAMAPRCAVIGCGRLVVAGTPHCYECAAQIEALSEWHRLHDGRETRARMAFFRACSAVRRRLWIPMLLFVVGTFSYIGFLLAADSAAWHFLEGGLQ